MTISLNLENDEKLRAYIKDLIKGQVLSVVRSDVNDIMTEVLKTKIEDKTKNVNLEKLLSGELQKLIRESILGLRSRTTYSNFIQDETNRIIKEYVEHQFKTSNFTLNK